MIFLCGGAATRLEAGRPLPVEAPPTYGPLSGTLVLELGFTADRIDGRGNLTVPLFRGTDERNMFFLDGDWSGQSDGNENGSAGLGFRHRFEDKDVIIGFNAFYDYGDYSGRGYNQFGVGFELLSQWFDFRANGYFPSYSVQDFGRYSSKRSSYKRTTSTNSSSTTNSNTNSTSTVTVIDGGEGLFPGDTSVDGSITTTTTTTNTTTNGLTTTNTRETKRRVRRTFERQESAMPGFDLELGGLVPYLDRWAETRIYAGYAFFDDPFGHDISCFTARLESRPLPALIFNAEYKGDSRLVDGENHWFFCARVEIPFDLGNLLHGQSPFAGITQAFTPQGSGWGVAGPSGDEKKVIDPVNVMRNRMNEGIVRNWRPTVSRTGYEKIAEESSVQHFDRSTTEGTRTQTTTTTTQTVVVPPQPLIDQ